MTATSWAILVAACWLYVFLGNIEDRRDVAKAAAWATLATPLVFLLVGFLVSAGFGVAWLVGKAAGG